MLGVFFEWLRRTKNNPLLDEITVKKIFWRVNDD